MKRLAAVLGAIAMIAAAVVVRGLLDDGGGGGGSGGGPDQVDAVVACDPALAEVCETLAAEADDLEVVVEPAARTADQLTDAAGPDAVTVDGWLTLAPQPALVAEARARAGRGPVLDETVGPLARSPLVLVAWTDRAQALDDACPELDWRCLGDAAGRPWSELGGSAGWGRVEPGLADPATDAVGLVVGGQAAVTWFGGAGFASNDFDGEFRSWWTDLLDAVPSFPASRGTVLAQMLAAGPASYDAVGTTEAEALPAVNASRDAERLVISYPSPVVTADVVLAPVLGHEGAEALVELFASDEAADAFTEAGWRVEGGAVPPGADPDLALPTDSGLPRPGVLEALRTL